MTLLVNEVLGRFLHGMPIPLRGPEQVSITMKERVTFACVKILESKGLRQTS